MSANPGPKRTTATTEDAGRSCPYCRFPLKEGAEYVECGVCHAGHHADCWDDNGNGCAVVACAGGPSDETRELAAQTARQPIPAPQQVQPQQVQPQAPTGAAPPAPAASWAGAESRGSRGPGPWLIAAVLVLALSVAGGAFAVVSSQDSAATTPTRTVTTAEASPNEGDTDSPPPGGSGSADAGEPETSEPAETTGVLPDVSRSQMASDIGDMLREHHQDIVDGDFSAAWDLYTSRKQQQKRDEEGYDAWRTSQATLSDYLDPSGLSVSIEDVDTDTGEVRVDVTGMGWSKPGASCSEWSGITWVRYENGSWLYEPGYSTTPARRAAWQDRFSELLGGNCSSG